MFRATIQLLAVVAMAIAATAGEKKTDAEADGYLGPVHKATTSRTQFTADGKPDGAPVVENEYVYDTLGRRIESFQSVGGHEYRTVFEWNGDRLARSRMTSNDPSRLETVNNYAPNGDILESVVSDGQGMLSREELEQTANGKQILVYGRDGGVTPRKVIRRNGKDEERLTYDTDGKLTQRVVRTWDQAANSWTTRFYKGQELHQTEVDKVDTSGDLVEIRRYDASGKPVQIFQARPDGSFQVASDPGTEGKTWSTVDESGHPVEFYMDAGTAFDWHKMNWDKFGRAVSNVHYDRAHTMIARDIFDYKDDEHGNWVRKTERHCEGTGNACVVTTVVTRSISYY